MDVITLKDVSKSFRIPHEKRDTIMEHVAGLMKGGVRYEEFWALRDINFIVEEGDSIGIIGENGCGKTTLLKLIANIIRPTAGEIRIDGRITPFLELGIGFQQDLTARDNVYLYGAIMGLSRGEIRERFDEIIDFAGLERFIDTKLKNFSSGMHVRLAFSTAIQTNPDILLVDEVLAVGDMEFQQKCIDFFMDFKKHGKTILFVTHDLGSVRRFCDKTLLLEHGRQIDFGGTNEVIDRYVYGGGKVGEPVERRDRWGDKRVEITDVKFYDKFGNENSTFKSSDPMTIRIYFNAREKVDDVVFGVAIYSDSDVFCYGTNTELKGGEVNVISGSGFIDLKIEKLTMLDGRFLLTVAAHGRDHKPYDWLDKKYGFNIIRSTQDAGLFDVPCEFHVK